MFEQKEDNESSEALVAAMSRNTNALARVMIAHKYAHIRHTKRSLTPEVHTFEQRANNKSSEALVAAMSRNSNTLARAMIARTEDGFN